MIDLDAEIGLQVLPNKTIDFDMKILKINNFNVTKDNCGCKNDEHKIKDRLNGVLSVIETSVNSLIRSM